MDEAGSNRGIDAAAQAADYPGFAVGYAEASAVVGHLFSDFLHGLAYEVAHFPVAGAAADFVEEVFQNDGAFGGVRDFGVKLDAEEFLFFVFYGGEGAGFGVGQSEKIVAGVFELVAVAGPNGGRVGEVCEKAGLISDGKLGPAEFPARGGDDSGAEDLAAELHTVADSEYGDSKSEDFFVAFDCVFVVNAGRAAGKDYSPGIQL